MSERPHFVYRCFDADDRLLYVGCTVNVAKRISAHHRDPHTIASRVLGARLDRVEVEGPFAGRSAGIAAEAAAIRAEGPLLNVQQSGAPMRTRWQAVAVYLDSLDLPLKVGGLTRCADCADAAPKYELARGRCQDCAYMHRHNLKWNEVPA